MYQPHDQYRDSRQIDKGLPELAARVTGPDVQNLLVKLLNENGGEFQEVKDKIARAPQLLKDPLKQVTEVTSGTEVTAVQMKRVKKSVDRFSPLKFDRRGRPIASTTGESEREAGQSDKSSESEESADNDYGDPDYEDTKSNASGSSGDEELDMADIVHDSAQLRKYRA